MQKPFLSDWHVEGWHYANENDDYGGRKIKTSHYAVKDTALGQEKKDIDHSPYEHISKEAFQAHVVLDFPNRKDSATVLRPWDNESIIDEMNLPLDRVNCPHLRRHIDELDASMFSGDAIYQAEARGAVRAYARRWLRRLLIVDLMEKDANDT